MTTFARRLFAATFAAAATLAVIGCAMNKPDATPAAITGAAMQGSVHGGQQPVAGASIMLFAATIGPGYAGTTQNILSQPVTSNAHGNFTFSSYTCTPGQQMYVVALGGDAGSGNNAQAAFMAALGDCNTLSSSTFISLNEITTVGSAFALAPFMQSYNQLGSTTTNSAGLTRAFASVNKLVDVGKGTAVGPALPPGAVEPNAEINTLGNILAYCVNSAGGTGSGTPCGKLFALLTPAGGTAPSDTISAALAIAHNPALNTASLFAAGASNGPFQTPLATAPADFSLAISYPLPQLQAPSATAIDAAGNIWVTNAGNNTVTVLSQGGTPLAGSPYTDASLSTPSAIAIDQNGNGWVANSTGSAVTGFTPAGGIAGKLTMDVVNPSSIAFDGAGNAWVGSAGNSLLLEFNAQQAYVQQQPLGAVPAAIAINPK